MRLPGDTSSPSTTRGGRPLGARKKVPTIGDLTVCGLFVPHSRPAPDAGGVPEREPPAAAPEGADRLNAIRRDPFFPHHFRQRNDWAKSNNSSKVGPPVVVPARVSYAA
jgi:hypothetical protein